MITKKTQRMNSFAVKCFWYPSRLSYTCLGACQQVQDCQMLLKYRFFPVVSSLYQEVRLPADSSLLSMYLQGQVGQILTSSTICFKVADIVRDNQAENSKYGQKIGKKSPNFQISCRLQMVSESRDFWQGGRKRFNLTRSILKISI